MKTTIKGNPAARRAQARGVIAGAKAIACALFASALLLSGCDKEPESEAEPTLSISPASKTITFGAEPTESYTFTVTTNQAEWTVSSDQDWCKVAPDAGAGTFTVTALSNDLTTAPPTATITVSAGKAAPIALSATQAAAEYVVYVAGTTPKVECYWIDGKQHMLQVPDDSKPASLSAMCIDGNSVYLAGFYAGHGCYWKDGVMQTIQPPQGATYSNCEAIAVSNGKVYLAGNARIEGVNYACYWEDGVPRWLDDRTQESNAKAIALSDDGSVHITGEIGSGAFYWNGSMVALEFPDGSRVCMARDIALWDGKVYIAGDYSYDNGSKRRAGYWEQGVFQPIGDLPTDERVYALALAIDNGVVHIAGAQDDTEMRTSAYVWNQEQGRTTLQQPGHYSEATGIAVCGGKVYACGSYIVEGNYIPCYWTDGVPADLPTNGVEAVAIAIAVKKK